MTDSAAICSDGNAHAYQSVRNTTPNGRGRRSTGPSTYWMIKPCSVHAITTTSRCRNRLRINSASNRPHSSTVIAIHEPSAASTFIVADRPGPSTPASHPTTASSTTVTATAGPRSSPVKTTSDSATSTTAAISQPTPVVRRGCGKRWPLRTDAVVEPSEESHQVPAGPPPQLSLLAGLRERP